MLVAMSVDITVNGVINDIVGVLITLLLGRLAAYHLVWYVDFI